MITAILIIILILNLAVLITFGAMVWGGAPYVPSRSTSVEKMMTLANIQAGEKAADLGSGDGRVVIAMAQQGAEAHGFENNPVLVFVARRNIRKAGLTGKAFIHWKNFWNADFSNFNVISVYAMPYIMGRLHRKMKREMKHGSRIISNAFEFKHEIPIKKEKGVYLYEISK